MEMEIQSSDLVQLPRGIMTKQMHTCNKQMHKSNRNEVRLESLVYDPNWQSQCRYLLDQPDWLDVDHLFVFSSLATVFATEVVDKGGDVPCVLGVPGPTVGPACTKAAVAVREGIGAKCACANTCVGWRKAPPNPLQMRCSGSSSCASEVSVTSSPSCRSAYFDVCVTCFAVYYVP